MTAPTIAPPRDLPALTGLRFLVAFWVVLFHCEKLIVGIEGYLPLMHQGYLGVDFFFLLSGFILAHVYGARFATGERGLWPRFVWLRFARIWPAYAVALAGLAGFDVAQQFLDAGAVRIEPGPWLTELAVHAAMLQSWGLGDANRFNIPGWSVSSEWLAYVLFPILGFIALVVRSFVGRLVFIALATLAIWYPYWRYGGSDLNHIGWLALPRLGGEFLIGVLVRAMLPDAATVDAKRRGDLALVLGLGGAVVLLPTLFRPVPVGDALALPLFALAIWGAAHDGPLARRLLAAPGILFLGEASYSVYLMQNVPIAITGTIGKRLGVVDDPLWIGGRVGLVMLAAVALGCLLYVLVEKPARAWLRRIGPRG